MKHKEKILPYAREVRLIGDQMTNDEGSSDQEMIDFLAEAMPEFLKSDITTIVKRERERCLCTFPYFPDLKEMIGTGNKTADYYSVEQEAMFYASVQE